MKALLLLPLLALSPREAIASVWGYGSPDFDATADGPPPSRYEHDSTVNVTFTEGASMERSCNDYENNLEGCADIGGPHIWITNPCTVQQSYAQILCHELAHTNGWAADHPR
jgi:hypothetical protein